ncbi:endolysin [Mycobacterium phage DrLupo]|uniref:Lysin A n=1 Tax=Mycobacterium phage DrLupo TaxID=2499037 RepID=A0A3S9UQK1_9CAUD|nr:endolysin [Mycobacterium phage DrLupo]AZS12577.1 lysin A [Mycobacterium phage DrLupo]
MSRRGDAVWLPDILRSAGLPVQVAEGANNRGHGDMADVWGVVDHHTGSDNASWQSIAYHPSLGLASQLHLSFSGLFTVCGVGIAWHAGNGSWPGLGTNNANPRTIGIEAANDGGGTPGRPHRADWPAVQYDHYVEGNAAILKFLNEPVTHSIGHKEWAGAAQGKWDPGGIDMNLFRKDIESAMRGAVPILNAIDEHAKVAAWLGKRLHPGEKPTADGKGRFAQFERGYIYWSAETGAFAIPSHLMETYAELGWEAGALGYPIAPHAVIPDAGDVQAFQRGVLYRKYGQPGHFITGAIGNRFRLNGWEAGWLGWPTTNETKQGGMLWQGFEHGRIAFSADGTVVLNERNEFV